MATSGKGGFCKVWLFTWLFKEESESRKYKSTSSDSLASRNPEQHRVGLVLGL